VRERGVFGTFYSYIRLEEVIPKLWEYGKGGGMLEVGKVSEGGPGGRGWWLRDWISLSKEVAQRVREREDFMSLT
jgi:hypothetical protein